MTGFKSYFPAHLKANIRTVIYILVITLSFTLVIGLNNQVYEKWDRSTSSYVEAYRATIGAPVTFMCILAYILPVMEFSFFKKRINLNCAYSMPISRRAMGTAHFLSGAIILVGSFTLSYLANFLLMLTRGAENYYFTPMIAHYFLCVLLGLVLYSVMTFVYNQANTSGDGIWFMVLWTFALILALSAIDIVLDGLLDSNILCSVPWGTIAIMTTSYKYIVEMSHEYVEMFWQSGECVVWFIIWVLIGIGAAVSFLLTFGKRRMEKTEEISDSFFGYRTLIPVYAIAGTIVFDSLIFWIIIEILALIGYAIYRRGFRFKLSDIIVMIAALIVLLI